MRVVEGFWVVGLSPHTEEAQYAGGKVGNGRGEGGLVAGGHAHEFHLAAWQTLAIVS